MKRINLIIAALLIAALAFTLPAMAAESAPHQSHKGMQMDHAAMKGKLIRETRINGYTLSYHLIDMKALMPDNANMAGTCHLMLTIRDPKGGVVEKTLVGYLIKGPDGKAQKMMAMSMGKGYGANIQMKTPGTYKITAKALIEGKPMIDRFTYEKAKK